MYGYQFSLQQVGILIMALDNTEKNSVIGFIFGIISSIGFSVFSVSLRWRKETPKFTTSSYCWISLLLNCRYCHFIIKYYFFQAVIIVHYFHYMEL